MPKEIPAEGKDLTQARNERCQKAVGKILQILLDEDLLFSDIPYVEVKVKEYFEVLFKGIIMENFDVAFDLLFGSLKHHFDNANKKLWKKDRDQITLRDIDEVLKEEKTEDEK